MKRFLITLAVILSCLAAGAQDNSRSAFFLPVDAGVSFSSRNGVGGAFYMRACLEYRLHMDKGLFFMAELDTRTHPYKAGGLVLGNVQAGDAAYVDLLVGPGYRWALTDSFKLAFSLQGGASNLAIKEVAAGAGEGNYSLTGVEKWYPTAKLGMMVEYYLNPTIDLFLAGGCPVTRVPVETASADPFVFFPTVSVGFNMLLF